MWPYWMVFVVPALAALTQATGPSLGRTSGSLRDVRGPWFILAFLITAFVGWRDEVGGDWDNYLRRWEDVAFMTPAEGVEEGDPGYWFLSFLSHELGGSIYSLNFACAALFTVGVILFCRQQPRPWLALAVAVPYLVIVVGMGYTRQAVALGISMIGLVALGRARPFAFVLWVALAALFHKSAVILIGLGMLASPGRSWRWNVPWSALVGVALYDAVLSESVDKLVTGYIEAEYQSEGALVRVVMNVVPAFLLLLLRKRFTWTAEERRLWTIMSLLALASLGWLAVSPSSTAVDRIALYLIPLQIYVFPRLPDVLARRPSSKRLWVGLILAYYALVQFVWLVYANNAEAWLPYQFYPLKGAF